MREYVRDSWLSLNPRNPWWHILLDLRGERSKIYCIGHPSPGHISPNGQKISNGTGINLMAKNAINCWYQPLGQKRHLIWDLSCQAKENEKEGVTGFSTKLKFHIQVDLSKILSVHISIHNSRQGKWRIHYTAVLPCVGRAGLENWFHLYIKVPNPFSDGFSLLPILLGCHQVIRFTAGQAPLPRVSQMGRVKIFGIKYGPRLFMALRA